MTSAIRVVAYDSEWPRQFDRERAALEQALAPWLEGGVHHVGSTAIPGLAAKPVIDIVAGVRDLEQARAAFGPLESLGYHHAPHRPHEAHWFAKPARPRSTHHLHLTVPGSDLWLERLAFRDALRADSALAAGYGALKERLAREHPDDLLAYTNGKRAFVAQLLARAGIQLQRHR